MACDRSIINTLPQRVWNWTLVWRLLFHEIWTCFAEHWKGRWWTTIHPLYLHVFGEFGNGLKMVRLIVLRFNLIYFFMLGWLMNFYLDWWLRGKYLSICIVFDWLAMRSALIVWVDDVHSKWRVIFFFFRGSERFSDLDDISFDLFGLLAYSDGLPVVV